MIRTLFWSIVVAAAVVVGLRFADSLATVGVSRVQVEADLSDAEHRQVRDAVMAELGEPGVSSAAEVASAVEQLGWVHQVRVRRRWPDTLHVAIVRETLAASWGDSGFLTTGGNVVPAPSGAEEPVPAELPILTTSLADGVRAMDVYNLLNASARDAGLRIAQLEEDRAGSWSVVLGNGVEVVLGSTSLRERFEHFLVVYRWALGNAVARIDRIDARYHAGVSVRWAADLAAVRREDTPGPTREK